MTHNDRPARPSWPDLNGRARAWRVAHATWSVVQLAALGYIWACAAMGRRDLVAWGAVTLLAAEGAGLVVGRGRCPMGRRQGAWGDPVPFFELLLPPRAAKAAVPVLAAVSLAGIGLLVGRSPGLTLRARSGRSGRGGRAGRAGR